MNIFDYEWRWVDDKGRGMTPWKRGNPPPILELKDAKGTMRVEFRDVDTRVSTNTNPPTDL